MAEAVAQRHLGSPGLQANTFPSNAVLLANGHHYWHYKPAHCVKGKTRPIMCYIKVAWEEHLRTDGKLPKQKASAVAASLTFSLLSQFCKKLTLPIQRACACN